MILRGLLPATRRSIVAASSLSRHRLQPQPPHLRPLCSTRIPGHDVDLSLTVVNVKALMESSGPLNAVQLTRLLADEEAGKNRVTLVQYITGKVQAAGGGGGSAKNGGSFFCNKKGGKKRPGQERHGWCEEAEKGSRW